MLHGVSAGVQQIGIESHNRDVSDLVVIGVPLDKSPQSDAHHLADDVLAEHLQKQELIS